MLQYLALKKEHQIMKAEQLKELRLVEVFLVFRSQLNIQYFGQWF